MYTPVPSNNEKEMPTKEALRTFSDVVSVSKATIFAASNSRINSLEAVFRIYQPILRFLNFLPWTVLASKSSLAFEKFFKLLNNSYSSRNFSIFFCQFFPTTEFIYSLSDSSTSTSFLIVIKFFPCGSHLRDPLRFSPTAPFMNSAFFITSSKFPYSSNHFLRFLAQPWELPEYCLRRLRVMLDNRLF